MLWTILLCVFIFGLQNCDSINLLERVDVQPSMDYYNRSSSAKGRLVAITVAQEPCRSSGSSADAGVCYPRKLCLRKGGTIITVADEVCGPLGSCCLFTVKPTSNKPITVNEKISTIVPNLDFANNVFSFPKMAGYCQLKVEFVEFTYQVTLPPTGSPTEGQVNGLSSCTTDSLSFSGSVTVSQHRFVICGPVPPDRLFFLSYGPTGESIRLNFRSNRMQQRSTFKLRVTQIGCDSEERVDDHCLFQYNEASGQVESFGYGNYQIAPQEYSVCIGNPSNTNIQRWTMCNTPPNNAISSFYLSSYFGPGIVPNEALEPRRLLGGFGDPTCERTSYVSIANTGKFCGAYFPPTQGNLLNILSIRFRGDDITEFVSPTFGSITTAKPPETCNYVVDADVYIQNARPIFHACETIGFTVPAQCVCTAPTTPTNLPARGDATGFCLEYN